METKGIGLSTGIDNLPITPPALPPQNEPFVHALLYVQKLIDNLLKTEESTGPSNHTEALSKKPFSETSSFDPGTLHFGAFFHSVKRLQEKGELFPIIKQRRDELLEQKEHWRAFVGHLHSGENRPLYDAVESVFNQGKLVVAMGGCGSAYFLIDSEGVPRYVVKPVDEDICCLNNHKDYGSPFNDVDHRVKDEIPLYRSAQTDAFCWEIARAAKLEGATPKAVMGIMHSEQFYDFTRWVPKEEEEEFLSRTGFPDKEKLCSIQEFIPESQDLSEWLHGCYAEHLSDEEISLRLDRSDVEQVFLLLWLSYDNDANGGNFCTYVKRIDETGRKIYGLKKIDNGLSFPEKNTRYTNLLTWSPHALFPISESLRQKILNLPIDAMMQLMDDYELSACKTAALERIGILQILAQREGITAGEIDLRLRFLSKENGKELVLSTLSTLEILALIKGNKTQTTAAEP
jgi:hypothetical protein